MITKILVWAFIIIITYVCMFHLDTLSLWADWLDKQTMKKSQKIMKDLEEKEDNKQC